VVAEFFFFFLGFIAEILLLVFCLGFIDEILLQWWLNFFGIVRGLACGWWLGCWPVGMAEFFSALSFFLHMAKCTDLWR